MSEIKSYRDLEVCKVSIELVKKNNKITSAFHSNEIYGLVSQMRRSAISIPSNIAEGSCKKTQKNIYNFLWIANGSLLELETQIEIAFRLNILTILMK